jgi:hypothetical protein
MRNKIKLKIILKKRFYIKLSYKKICKRFKNLVKSIKKSVSLIFWQRQKKIVKINKNYNRHLQMLQKHIHSTYF